jgi:pyridinium-3,5-bisthiocarboxylic acid mononucleotide nickel chelatase
MPRIAYLDCSSGISGDMTLAALIDAGVPVDRLNDAIGSLGLPGCRLVIEEVKRHGFRALKATVETQPEHVHRHLPDIAALIDASVLTLKQKATAKRIFGKLAEAEAKVHGIPADHVHFHEVGAADSIADIVGAAVGFDLLGVERIIASPVPTGMGKIKIAHGECGIPAPATAELLRGIPLAESHVEGELTTPTGAAILASLAEGFGPPPAMTVRTIGYGAGSNDWSSQPNILRLMLGETSGGEEFGSIENIYQLETAIDNLSGEIVGYCIQQLQEAGALDVYTTAIAMKKNRPGVLLTVLCNPAEVATMEEILFRETTTLGIRRLLLPRRVLKREPHAVETPWGSIAGKIAQLAEGRLRFTPEYESCRMVAERHGRPLHEIYEAAQKAFLFGKNG